MPDRIIVIHSDGKTEPFKPRMISQTIQKETKIDEKLADKIQRRIASKIYKLRKDGMEEISTAAIRAEVSSQLLQEREFYAEEQYRKLGMSVAEFEDLLKNGCKDNANIGYSPEMISKYAYDAIAKEYALLTMPNDCAQAHIDGYVHHHDLEFFNTRPNCMNFDIRFFAKNGLKIDGKGQMGSVAKPAKSLEVLLNHLQQAFMAGAVVFSGGQGLANFNTFLAPFAKGRDYKDIKQAVQAFIFNCNMALVCRGGQVLFSSIGMDLNIPDVLKDEPAIGPQGIASGVYGDYEEEADLIFRAVCEVLQEKDGQGAYHRFPNTLFNIRKGDLDKYEGNCKLLHELSAVNPTIYFVNCMEEEATVMGCRTRLPMNYSGDYAKDCLNTGNFMYSTLNLPLIAHKAKDEGRAYLDVLNEYCDIIYRTLKFRRKEVEKRLFDNHMSDFLLWKDKETGEPLYDLDRCTYTLGFCGLYEACKILGYDSGEPIVQFLNDKKVEYNQKDGWRWSVIGSPAESTAHRFAMINKEKYPNTVVQGKNGNLYLTNSTHIPVLSDANIVEHIKNADKYHKYTGAGNILHIWMSESYPDPEAIWRLNQKISQTNTLFWAFSRIFSYCEDCNFTLNDAMSECYICGSQNIRQYDRITGYYIPILGYNAGKKQEFRDRYRHSFN